MPVQINIDPQSCIRCGKCAKVCPSKIMTQEKAGAPIELQHTDNCIVCGHCAAVCPTGAVFHSDFPKETIHPIDRAKLPTPEQVLLLCRTRRSNRALSNRPVPQEAIDLILEAAHRAPTASNLQQVQFTVITDPKAIENVIRFTVETLMKAVKTLENPLIKLILKRRNPFLYERYVPTFRKLDEEYRKGNDLILRGAKALILIHTPRGSRFGAADANLAYQNGSLMAESLNISQIYTGFFCAALKQDKKRRFLKSLGIEGEVHAAMALGMPQFLYPNYIDKRPIEVKKI